MAQARKTAVGARPRLYEPAEFYLLRAPVLPASVFEELAAQAIPPGTRAGELSASWAQARRRTFEVVRRHTQDPVVRQALAIASADLSHGLRRVQHGNGDPRRTERAYAALFRYLVRMSTRPTPFGLFAAVGFGNLGAATTLRLDAPSARRLRARPDMGWLVSVIKLVEQEGDLARRLEVLVNHLVYVAGSRAVLPQFDIDRENDDRAVTLHAGQALRYVLREARRPIAYETLRERLHEAFPHAAPSRVEDMLRELFGHHVLVSNLRPPLTSPSPGRYVLDRLRPVPGTSGLRQRLTDVLAKVQEVDRAGVGAPAALIDDLAAQQRALTEVPHQTVQVDAALNVVEPSLNAEVGDALADAAEALLRVTPAADGLPHLREYHAAFVERYGSGTEVPVQELLSPERGLEAPPGYHWPQRSYPLPPVSPPGPTERDEVLCAVLADALRAGSRQVELDDELVDRLSTPQPPPGGPPARAVEMIVQIAAASREALDRGEWQAAAIPGCAVPEGRMFGRFLDLLGDDALEALRAYARREERLFPELIFAELSYFPAGRRGNVVLCPRLRDHEIVVNTTPSLPPERVIDLDDVVVGADDQRFYLRSLSRGRRVVVTQSHMLNLMLAPNVCRFLLEVSADGRPLPYDFDWGVVRNAPRLPRLVRDKVVLSPAQWNLRPSPATGVPPAGGDERFFLALRGWRATWQVPRHVYLHLEDGGDRLLLDLEHPLSVAQLRKELDKAGGSGLVRLQELLPGFRHLWLRDGEDRAFFSEIVVPLLPRRATARSGAPAGERHPAQRPVDPHGPVPDDVRYVLPGGDWTYLKLYTPARQHDELIAGPARDIVRVLRERGLVDHWFFVRYRDPAPHLRVRFHARAPDDQGAVLVEAAAWARELAGQGLINRVVLEPYVREVERYGGPDAVAVMEQVFSADSTLVSDVLLATRSRQLTLDPTVIAAFTLDRLAACFGLDFPGRQRFIEGVAGGDREPVAALQERRLLLGDLLVDRDARRASLAQEQAAQGGLLAGLWAVQEPTLRPLFARVRELAEHGKLWQPEQDILASLVHMHVNRLLGIDAEREGIVYALWRHTLESIRRRGQVTGDRA